MKIFITSILAHTYLPHLKWEKVCSSRVITVLDWLKISGSAADRVFEVVSSEIVEFTVVVALVFIIKAR
ncbi:hypothetical protein F2Q70_00029007 [Brassica cretica]|uniref:Uncharacterized protein n=2 Tax=Brassica cretica TaxID=69181 RepID=A0A8S9H5H7_BRACR|nr:hypothetical protein F2Q70_00029007 [Brassica cretica]KAF2551238.1 hypothetical protein F2Q68_00033382 [Brassica cretica]KAF3594559.1 hypothetical protein DY000_02020105 [Brassica cretica]